jgi:hypothetical protein
VGRAAGAIAAGLVLALGGCSKPKPVPETIPLLPTAQNLPYGFNKDCGCVRDGDCASLDQRLGEEQVRNVSCRWARPPDVAECSYEYRFVPMEVNPDKSLSRLPAEWRAYRMKALHLAGDEWCRTG